MAAETPIVVTAGDPAGIGPEICSALAESPWADKIVVVGDKRLVDERLDVIDLPFPAPIVPGPVIC